jgi:hypothetical protein
VGKDLKEEDRVPHFGKPGVSQGSTQRSKQKVCQICQVRSVASAREATIPARDACCAAPRSLRKVARSSDEQKPRRLPVEIYD